MALTAEQQAQLDMQTAQQQLLEAAETARRNHEITMENLRHQNALALSKANTDSQQAIATKHSKMEAVRLAKETLIENRRNKPVDQREVSVADITAFADSVLGYVNN